MSDHSFPACAETTVAEFSLNRERRKHEDLCSYGSVHVKESKAAEETSLTNFGKIIHVSPNFDDRSRLANQNETHHSLDRHF